MRAIPVTLVSVILLLGLTEIAQAKEWRGITPLRSTRADVERLFDPSAHDGYGVSYPVEDEVATFEYSSGNCSDRLSATEANGSGRKLFNCQPLPHSAGFSHVWVGVNDKEFRLADGTADDNIGGFWADLGAEEWTRRTASDRDALEKWNPLNLQYSNAPHTAGRLRPKLARVTRLWQLYKTSPGFGEIRGAYERFDTGDLVNFKITGAPSFAAPEIPFSTGRGEIKVYLVPRMTLHTFQTGAGTPYNANPYR